MIAILLAGGLVGLWGSERVVGAGVQGELTVAQGTARIAGLAVPVQIDKSSLRFELPEGRGSLRAHASGDGWRGHFIQPRALVGGAPFATPVELRPSGPGAWRGEISPLEQRFCIYLNVSQQPDGSLRAVLRNPELNVGRGHPLAVQVQGSRVRFLDGAREFTTARFDPAKDTLTIEGDLLDGGASEVTLTRRRRDGAPGFWPGTSTTAYTYRAPVADGDGWSTAPADDQGVDLKRLAALVQHVLDTDPSATPFPAVQGVVIARHGKLVLEEYFYGFAKDRLHDWRSAGKSFGTTLVGAAIDHGAAIDLRAPLISFFPESPQPAEKRAITVEHALTMSTGLACDDDDDDSPGQEDRMQSQPRDWYAYTLDLPVAHPAGTHAAYCSATINLLGGVVRHATSAWLTDLFDAQIAQPLGISRYALNLGPNLDMYFAGGLRLRPRDFLKLGQAFLDGGVWNGKRVVSAGWVQSATSPHAKLNNGSSDGYNWWLREIGGVKTFSAGGNGGQFVVVAPALDLAVAFTGGMYGGFGFAQKTADELLTNYIFPAVTKAQAAAPR
jgi:CubicO group peptidase (beta-lactamase class C family)